jgi:hypothetical protein
MEKMIRFQVLAHSEDSGFPSPYPRRHHPTKTFNPIGLFGPHLGRGAKLFDVDMFAALA